MRGQEEPDRHAGSLTSLKRRMAYKVEMTARAERDYRSLFYELSAQDSLTAARWRRKLREAILSLEEMPQLCPVTPENARLMHLLYGRKPHVYRIIFRVLEKEKTVQVVHIRHAARQAFEGRGSR